MKRIISLLIAMTIVITSFPTVLLSSAAEVSIPTAAKVYNGHSYAVYSNGKTWSDASKYCESKGGHLVTITSAKEQAFLSKLISNKKKNWYWIGATDERVEGTWRWVTGEKVEYANWSEGEPNNWRDNEGNYENYAFVKKDTGKWVDVRYYGGYGDDHYKDNGGFICEWDSIAGEAVTLNTYVEVESTDNGTISVSNKGKLPKNTIISLTATPAKGYIFSEWDVYGGTLYNANGNTASLKAIDSSVQISAIFKKGIATSKHFILDITENQHKLISDSTIKAWLSRLDSVYEAYYDLVGAYPCNGAKLTITSGGDVTYGWAWVNGSPNVFVGREYMTDYIRDKEKDGGAFDFGMYHEIGHLFDEGWYWNFQAEQWANFKMFYVREQVDKTVLTDDDVFWKYYKNVFIDNRGPLNNTNDHDAVSYMLYQIVKKYSWEPFKQMFRTYKSGSTYPAPDFSTYEGRVQCLNTVLDILSESAGKDVRNIFTNEQLRITKECVGGGA